MSLNLEAFFDITLTQILFGFSRASGLVMSAPVFQSRFIPPQVKMVFAFMLALVIAPFIRTEPELEHFTFIMAVFSLVQEILVGLIMGFMVNLTFYAIQFSGYLMDVPMGFGVINILDPSTGTEMPLLGQFNYILAIIIFLAIDGHHTLIKSLIQSYSVVKPAALFLHKETVGLFVQAFAQMFFLGLKISLPILGTIFLTDVALGIVAKLVPQINVFMIGFPVKIVLGLFILTLFIPLYIILLESLFANGGETFGWMKQMLQQLRR